MAYLFNTAAGNGRRLATITWGLWFCSSGLITSHFTITLNVRLFRNFKKKLRQFSNLECAYNYRGYIGRRVYRILGKFRGTKFSRFGHLEVYREYIFEDGHLGRKWSRARILIFEA